MKKLTTILILTFLLVSGFSQKQVLQLQLVKGQIYKQNMDAPIEMRYEVGDETMDMEMNLKMNLNYTVVSAENDGYELEAKFELLHVVINAMGNKIVMSSEEGKGDEIVYKFFHEITKNSFKILIDKSGNAIEVIGYAEMLEKSIKKLPNISKSKKEELKRQFSQSFNEETIKQNLSNIGNFFPTTPVGIGDKWDHTFSSNAGSEIIVNGHYTVIDITPEYILIDLVGDVTSPEENEYVETEGIMMKMSFKGTMSSTIKIDSKTMWTISNIGEIEMTGIAEMEPNDNIPDGIKMNMSIQGKIVINDGSNPK